MSMSTPVLPSAEDLAGNWRLSWSGGACAVQLSARPVAMPRPAADAWDLTLDPACAANPALDLVSAWRPASDGITLVDAQGRDRLFLSRTRSGAWEAVLPPGQTLRLTRD
ncbi:MAG: protease inhibitor Inh/omp19 family protein [Brevundimonas sp.]